jgi:hypothetical protein
MSILFFFRNLWAFACVMTLLAAPGASADSPYTDSIGQSALNHTDPRYQRAMITPTLVHLDPGEQQKFVAVMVATRLMAAEVPEKVVWSVNDIPGGNASVGTIDEKGVYTAPAAIPSPREIIVVGEVPQAANPFLFATVIIGDAPIHYKSVHIWSEERKAEGSHLSTPHGIGLDKDENILITDMGNAQVHRFTQTGEFIDNIGLGKGSADGSLIDPREVTSDIEGRIFIADSKGDRPRIQVFSHEGQFLQIFGEKGRLPGMLLRAHGLGFDRARNLFVVDVDNMRVNVYDQYGKSLRDWGTEGLLPGELNAPHGLYVDRSGDVFVTGYYGPTQKFNGHGEFVEAFAHGAPPDGPSYFHSVSGDQWGNVYVSVRNKGGYDGAIQRGDEGYYSIMKYNNNGDFICGWSYTANDHSESEVAVAKDGRVFCLFNGPDISGVETFAHE